MKLEIRAINKVWAKAFVNKSANCSLVGQYCSWIDLFFTALLIQWSSVSRCFMRDPDPGFFAQSMAALLSSMITNCAFSAFVNGSCFSKRLTCNKESKLVDKFKVISAGSISTGGRWANTSSSKCWIYSAVTAAGLAALIARISASQVESG